MTRAGRRRHRASWAPHGRPQDAENHGTLPGRRQDDADRPARNGPWEHAAGWVPHRARSQDDGYGRAQPGRRGGAEGPVTWSGRELR